MRASSRPEAMASMIAWRLLPRPEMRTPMDRVPGFRGSGIPGLGSGVPGLGSGVPGFRGSGVPELLDILDGAVALDHPTDDDAAGAPARLQYRDHFGRRARIARDDQSNPHVEGAQHFVIRDLSALLQEHEKRRNGPTVP